jgi:hypothetical protein
MIMHNQIARIWSLPGLIAPRLIALGAVMAIGSLFLPRAGAAIIAPGGSAPTTGGATFSGTAIHTETDPFNSGTFAGNLTSTVYQESNGWLDFVYQFSNSNLSGADGITTFTGAGFNYLFANADDQTVAGDVSPTTVERDPATSNGLNDTIRFLFSPGVVLPGQTSDLLVVKTHAMNWYEGSASLIDSIPANVQAPMPVPEPATLGLLTVGLVGLLARPGRKSSK